MAAITEITEKGVTWISFFKCLSGGLQAKASLQNTPEMIAVYAYPVSITASKDLNFKVLSLRTQASASSVSISTLLPVRAVRMSMAVSGNSLAK